MADSATTSSDAAAQRAAEQARLRKERREAKIKAGGSARLSKINGMGGRITGDSEQAPPSVPDAAPLPTPQPQPASVKHKDPEEVDISEHYYDPAKKSPNSLSTFPPSPFASDGPPLSDAQLQQMMLGLDRTPQAPGTPAQQAEEEDPLMKLMSQMMGGKMPDFASGDSPFAGLNIPQSQAAPQPAKLSFWKILHALVALGLGAFFLLTTPFAGSKIERERKALNTFESVDQWEVEEEDQRKRIFFWTFATAEVLLLSSRFFFDKASTNATGFVGTVFGYVPQPYRGYLEVIYRYFQIFAAVRTDILTCIFALGLWAMWNQ